MALSNTKLQRFIDAPQSMKNDPDYPLFQAGLDEGRASMKRDVLSLLEIEYMDDAIERGSEKGKYILELAKELSQKMTELITK